MLERTDWGSLDKQRVKYIADSLSADKPHALPKLTYLVVKFSDIASSNILIAQFLNSSISFRQANLTGLASELWDYD